MSKHLDIQQVLIRHWGFSAFRPLQEDIIKSVLSGQDTLALLPTGGGKSLCFQVPAMAMEGICIVISPLIALMKDQVENLQQKNIKAMAVFSGMSSREIDIALDNCVYGDYKFLYVSPERIETEIFKQRVRKMNVCLLAIDEAHCISQWGYDFRPPYLRIADARKLMPDVPVLALTATATPEVVTDIQEKLGFPKPNVFQKSFERRNLTYAVAIEEDKLTRLHRITQKIPGTGIVYVRNRKKTVEIAKILKAKGVSADYYHAGLDVKTRDIKQESWKKGKTRIIVCTNAFGMGIDKPDVRFVVHLDLPDSLEAYFQEAGRGGRDEKDAWSVILFYKADIDDLRSRLDNSFPDKSEIIKIYNTLGNYYQLATGSGENTRHKFILSQFCKEYELSPIIVHSALGFLEKDGYLSMSDAYSNPSKVYIEVNKEELYRFQLEQPSLAGLIKLLLRSYGGLFTDFVKINEEDIAFRSKTDVKTVQKALQFLMKKGIITYSPRSSFPQIIFLQPRHESKNVNISRENYDIRKKVVIQKAEAVIDYVSREGKCRSIMLLNYFGEKKAVRCGKCDACLKRNKLEVSEVEFDRIVEMIKPLLLSKFCSVDELLEEIPEYGEDKLIKVIQWLADNNKIVYDDEYRVKWKGY